MLQDRNIHRDAQALRKSITVPLIVPAFGVDQDEPIYASVPRYNWRLSDFHTFVNNLANNALTVSAQAVPPGAVVGSPRLLAAAAVTFGIDEFWLRNPVPQTDFVNLAATAAQAFGADGVATVLDGFWGVWLVVVDDSLGIGVLRQAPIMAFATEEIALANCPKPRPFQGGSNNVGRLAILTVNAVGGDFIAGTTNTNDGVVNLFNTAPQQGHVVTIGVGGNPHMDVAVLGQQLKDASGTNILQGKGGDGGDALVVMTKCFGGASVLTGPAQAVVEYRPWPAGGEGLGDTSVSQNRPSFVP